MVLRTIRSVLVFALVIGQASISAQDDQDTLARGLSFSGYVDAYYSFDFGRPQGNERPTFTYNYNRHNEVNLNLCLAKVDYQHNRVRGALGLIAGTYPQANLIHEPELLRNIYEARVGVKLSKSKKLWLDAGVFGAHIGFESAVGIDNWTLTRSLNAENSPYYLSGAKITYTISDKLEIAGLFVNGWQRMRRIQNNTPCFGTQVLWSVKDGMKLNWSTFLGSDTPDSLALYRVFNNVWWNWEGKKWGVRLATDIGAQESPARSAWDMWAGGVIVIRRAVGKDLHFVGRAEYYTDPEQVIVSTNQEFGLSTLGFSLGLDLHISDNANVRLEGRSFRARDKVFENIHGPAVDNTAVTISIASRF